MAVKYNAKNKKKCKICSSWTSENSRSRKSEVEVRLDILSPDVHPTSMNQNSIQGNAVMNPNQTNSSIMSIGLTDRCSIQCSRRQHDLNCFQRTKEKDSSQLSPMQMKKSEPADIQPQASNKSMCHVWWIQLLYLCICLQFETAILCIIYFAYQCNRMHQSGFQWLSHK